MYTDSNLSFTILNDSPRRCSSVPWSFSSTVTRIFSNLSALSFCIYKSLSSTVLRISSSFSSVLLRVFSSFCSFKFVKFASWSCWVFPFSVILFPKLFWISSRVCISIVENSLLNSSELFGLFFKLINFFHFFFSIFLQFIYLF